MTYQDIGNIYTYYIDMKISVIAVGVVLTVTANITVVFGPY